MMTPEMKAFHDTFEACVGDVQELDEYDWQHVFNIDDGVQFRSDAYPVAPGDVAEVTNAWVWRGDYAEMSLSALMRLTDGQWAAVVAWCDTTGWGCQDGVDWAVGTREHVIAQGLDLESRRHLGLTLPGESGGVS